MTVDDYQIKFSRDPLMGLWSYEITTPDGRTLHPIFGVYIEKASIERAALRRIELDQARETVSGTELAERVNPELMGQSSPWRSVADFWLAMLRKSGAETQRAASACSEPRPGVGADPDRTESGDRL